MTMESGGIPITNPATKDRKIAMLLWGPSGCGKTTLASTLPGKKLWIQYDPGGTDVVANRKDVLVMDFSDQPISNAEKWRESDPFKLTKFIRENKIESIVFDSLTTFAEVALQHGVAHAAASRAHMKAGVTHEDPGYGGYGRRKTWMRLALHNMLRVAGACGVHICFIGHEDSPDRDTEGAIISITIALGSDMPSKFAATLGEVWWMRDNGKQREIAIRAVGVRSPMKSRMFSADVPTFVWKYDAASMKGMTLESFYDKWKANKWSKISVPV